MEPQAPDHPPQGRINYLYFGIYFALVVLMSASSVFTKNNLSGSRIFFFLYAAGQVALETSLLVFLGFYIRRFLGRLFFHFYIGATFVLFLFHIFDFLMDRILDLSVWETISCFILDDDFHNFLYLLDASGIPLWIWGIGLLALTLVPIIGIFLYRMAESLTNQKPLLFYPEKFLLAFVCLPTALFFWDFSASRIIHPDAYTHFLQSLPWKYTFLEPKAVVYPLSHPLKHSPDEHKVAQAILNAPHAIDKKPNIYLFIAESLRRDIITQEITPHLFAFSQETSPCQYTLSNANGTNLSWFSIFHSQFAYHWNRLKQTGWEMGSPPLTLLKKWGYQINVYTSAQLGYYGLEKLLFGAENHLLNTYQTFHHKPPLNAADGDAAALTQLQQDIANNPSLREGQVFIIFWDASHFDYSWPKHWTPKFTPFANEFAFFKAFYSRERIELIKNRYKNAVSYLDSLFGHFLSHLPNREESIIVFTGDHGEEFFEHGHLFHNSHLTQEQTLVPLCMKLGTAKAEPSRKMVSQIDIFPSIIDYLSGAEIPLLEGQSILRKAKWPYAVTSRFNASRDPYEFFIHNGKYKLVARFSNRSDTLQSESLHIRSLRTADDQTIPEVASQLEMWIEQEFGPALDHL